MWESIGRRFGGLFGFGYPGLAGLFALGVIACAATTATNSDLQGQTVITGVRVEKDGEATRVVLEGLDHPVFTAFQQSNPERVVIDLASVEPERLMDPVAVHDGLVEEVSISPFSTGTGDSMTRVEIALSGGADYRVNSTSEGLEVIVEAGVGAESLDLLDDWADANVPDFALADEGSRETTDGEAGDRWAIEPIAVAPGEAEGRAVARVTWEAPTATELTGIEASATSDQLGSLIRLRANGTVSSAITFTLSDPERLVIDLPSMLNGLPKNTIPVNSIHASGIRVGQHEGMVRVVIDAASWSEPFDGRRVVPAPDGMLITLGSGPELDLAVTEIGSHAPPSATAIASSGEMGLEQAIAQLEVEEQTGWEDPTGAPASNQATPDDFAEAWALAGGEDLAATDEIANPALRDESAGHAAVLEGSAGPVLIYGVEYSAQESVDRILIFGERPVDYLVYEPDPETVVLSIEGATIDSDAAVRIAPDAAGPVSLITAFEQPDVATSEVRVVMKRASNLQPVIHRKGSLLLVDFPRTGAIAARPPLLEALDKLSNGADDALSREVIPGLPASLAPGKDAAPDAPRGAAEGAAFPAALEPPAAIAILEEGGLHEDKEYVGRRISLDFKDVDVADVLRLIAEVSDLNVIAGDEVKGKVTIRLVDVPWDQALDVILLTKGLGFVRVGNVLRIAPAALLKTEDEMRLQERRNIEALEDLIVKLQPVNYANVTSVAGMIKKLLTPRGTVDTDTRTNTLIIKDIPTVVDEATALVKAIDTQTPQVMIEAKIVEANLDFDRKFGSSWSFGSQPLVDGFTSGSGPRQDLGGRDFRFHDENNVSFGNPVGVSNGVFNLAAFIIDEKMNLDLKLEAAETNGDGKVISSPRVVTLDNTTASIEQGVAIPFQTFENGDAQLEFVDAVLKLDVTPHITGDRSIVMKIEVSRNAPDSSVFTLTGSPAIAKNQVKTETLVADGQTLVLGGIYVVDKSKTSGGVPFVKDIPIIGWAFKSQVIEDNRKELLMFVTPNIVRSTPDAM